MGKIKLGGVEILASLYTQGARRGRVSMGY